MTASVILEALVAADPEVVRDIVLPRSSGFYAWWAAPERLADADPAIPAVHPRGQRDWSLLYVGIAPKKPSVRSPSKRSSERTIADRITSDHRGGNIGGSTFRQSLAALLIGHLGLIPKPGHDRSRVEDETALNAWIHNYCRLSVFACEQPWEYEQEVIRLLCPPLNLRPGYHEFRHEVDRARRALRRACRI